MVISLKLDSDTPLYEQLRNQIVIGIATGKLLPQEKLPTVRQLAEDLGINTMTVNKAYALLKQEGYIVIVRRHGAKVNWQPADLTDSTEHTAKLEQKLELIIAEAVIHGIDNEHFHKLCEQTYEKMNDYH